MLALALRITSPGLGDGPDPGASPGLAPALHGQAAHQWAEAFLLNRDLLSGGPGAYDLFHALHVTGRIATPAPLR